MCSSDAERALTALGQQQAEKTGQWLAGFFSEAKSVRLLTSPYRRARETAAIIAAVLGVEPVEVASITPDHDPRVALPAIAAAAADSECLVVVTHMPLVAALASWLEVGVLSSGQSFSLAEARLFEMPVLAANAASEQARFSPSC